MGKRVLVVGAGIIGASVAWHLTGFDCEVTIVDACDGGGLATRNSYAWINASWGNPEWYFHFRRRSMAGWRELERSVPGVSVNWCGGLLWDLPPADLEAYAQQHAAWGYGIRPVDRKEILKIEPSLKNPPELALHVAEEGMLEPLTAAKALLAAAIARGGRFLKRTEVASLHIHHGRIAGVETTSGETLLADEVLITAGAGTAKLLESGSISLAIDAPPGLIAHSTISDRKLLNGLVMTPEFHVRQTQEGRLVIGSDFAGGDPQGRDGEMASELLEKVQAEVSGAERLKLDFLTVGYRPTPRDGYPAIGWIEGLDGVYVAALHSGVTLAPVVGELAAREIATGARDPDLGPYDPSRAALRPS